MRKAAEGFGELLVEVLKPMAATAARAGAVGAAMPPELSSYSAAQATLELDPRWARLPPPRRCDAAYSCEDAVSLNVNCCCRGCRRFGCEGAVVPEMRRCRFTLCDRVAV